MGKPSRIRKAIVKRALPFPFIYRILSIIMPKKDPNKPRGKMSSYAFFVQTCREEHRKKHPDEQVVFAEFSKKCAEKSKNMNGKEKGRFEEMAAKDKARYEREMTHYIPPKGEKGRKRRRTKDPNAPSALY